MFIVFRYLFRLYRQLNSVCKYTYVQYRYIPLFTCIYFNARTSFLPVKWIFLVLVRSCSSHNFLLSIFLPSILTRWHKSGLWEAFIVLTDGSYSHAQQCSTSSQPINVSGWVPWMWRTYLCEGKVWGGICHLRKKGLILKLLSLELLQLNLSFMHWLLPAGCQKRVDR